MSYLLEEFVERIQGPVICRIDGGARTYNNGKELAQVRFEKPYRVSAIAADRDAVVLELKENTMLNETAWAGEEQVGFF